MLKVAIFVAGDKNIFFPAVIALNSIIENNPDLFDAFISFPKKDLTNEMVDALEYYKINYIDSSLLEEESSIEDMPLMMEMNWPKEIFLNWVFPYFLLENGYEYSIKVDYDILCLDSYDIDEIIPKDNVMSGLQINVDLQGQGLNKEFLNELSEEGLYDKSIDSYINVGFVCINNKLYCELDFFGRLKTIYIKMLTACPQTELAEQAAVAIALSTTNGVFKISGEYNQRIRWASLIKPDLKPSIKNIHYITKMKPWLPLERSAIRDFTKRKQGMVFLYRSIWLHAASKSPWFNSFCSQKKLEPIEELGLTTVVCHWYNHRINELENEVKVLRAGAKKKSPFKKFLCKCLKLNT